MLSLWKLRVGAEAYYLGQVARGLDDYYIGGSETRGRWIGAGAGLNRGSAELAVLGGALLFSTIIGLFLLADFRSAPSGFPWPEGSTTRSARRASARSS